MGSWDRAAGLLSCSDSEFKCSIVFIMTTFPTVPEKISWGPDSFKAGTEDPLRPGAQGGLQLPRLAVAASSAAWRSKAANIPGEFSDGSVMQPVSQLHWCHCKLNDAYTVNIYGMIDPIKSLCQM